MNTRLDWVEDVESRTGPCDRPSAERSIEELYRVSGFAPPSFRWFESPLAAVREALNRDALGDAVPSEWELTFRQKLIAGSLSDQARGCLVGSLAIPGNRFSPHPYIAAEVIARTRQEIDAMPEGSEMRRLSSVHHSERDINWIRSRAIGFAFHRPFDFSWGNGDAPAVHGLRAYPVSSYPFLCAITEHCGWWRAEPKLCYMSERPMNVPLDRQRRPHGRLTFPDGFTVHFIHGVRVTERIFSGNITVLDIEQQANAEVRRTMINMYGADRFIIDSGAALIDRDSRGELYRKDLPHDEPIVLVKVTNSTSEPDGTFKHYYLRVPPEMRTAREAVAWTFGMEGSEYEPSKEI